MRSKTITSSLAGLLLLGGAGAGLLYYAREQGPEVQIETIARRDLVAVVSASGKIQPKRSVDISADTIGRVTRLAVQEGESVKAGQFLLQIDPETLESAVERGEAGLRAAREAVNETRIAVEAARANWELARQTWERHQELYRDQLISRDLLERVESEVKVRESELEARQAEVRAQEQRLQQEIANLRSARHNLRKVTIDAPMEGLVTRLQIEEGETVLVGTMNNPGTVLMTIADLSVIQAELEVDETDVVDLRLGQPARVIVDAFPNTAFRGRVTRIGSSAIEPSRAMGAAADRKATAFSVEVTLEDEIPDARPGFSCLAEITTATRSQAVAVPIQALTVRETELGYEGHVVVRAGNGPEEHAPHSDFISGANKKEVEGVFVVRDGRAFFNPVEVGIAGERYFEVLSGLRAGDRVIVGPYTSIRELADGSPVRIAAPVEVPR